MFIKCTWQLRVCECCTCNHIHPCQVSHSLYCHFQSSGFDFTSNSAWYLAVTLMTFRTDRKWLHVTPIRRNTPLYGKLLDKPRLLLANLGMNNWKGQSWAPWWGWHIWLAEWSNWHSLRKEEKGHCYLSSSGRSWLCLEGGPYHATYWAFATTTTCMTEVNIVWVYIKTLTAVPVAVLYQVQDIKDLLFATICEATFLPGVRSSMSSSENASGSELSAVDINNIWPLNIQAN